MLGTRSSDALGRTRLLFGVYYPVFTLAMLSLLLGMNLITLAQAAGQGDPYQVRKFFQLSVGLLVAGIAGSGFMIQRGVQRLCQFGRMSGT
jgi:hypothetical protein